MFGQTSSWTSKKINGHGLVTETLLMSNYHLHGNNACATSTKAYIGDVV
jgi:hypothetical protein